MNMIQTIIQNTNNGQTAVTDLPQSRMNMAGMLASIGIRQPAYEISFVTFEMPPMSPC